MKIKDWAAFILLGTIWGSSFLWIKIGVQEIGPLLLVSLRLLFGIAFLGVVAIIARPRLPKKRGVWIALIILGFINTAIPYVLITWGEQYIDSSVAAILNATTPLFTMLIAQFFLRDDRMTLMRFVGLLIGFFGIAVLVSRDLDISLSSSVLVADTSNGAAIPPNYLKLLGQMAVLLASCLYAVSSVFARRTTEGISPIVLGLIPLLGADAVLWMLTYTVESPVSFSVSGITAFAVVWLGLMGTGFAFLLYFYLIHSVGPTRATLVTYVFPIVGIVLGVVFLGERLDWNLILGCALIVGSIIVVNTRTGAQVEPQSVDV